MSATTLLLLIGGGWLGIGLALSLVLGRRGHDGFMWFVLGTVLGPLALPLAIDAWRHHEIEQQLTVGTEVTAGDPDGVAVLVGFDGSAEAEAAITAVIKLLGARLGRLALAMVIPYDGGTVNERQACAALEAAAERFAWLAPELTLLRGHPATALAAAVEDFDVLAVGTTTAGRTHLFGSTARELAQRSAVPLLVAGPRPLRA